MACSRPWYSTTSTAIRMWFWGLAGSTPTTKSSGRTATVAGPVPNRPRATPVSSMPNPCTVASSPLRPVTVMGSRLRYPMKLAT